MRPGDPLPADAIKALEFIQVDRRLTKAELSREMGVPPNTITRALRGQPIWQIDRQRMLNWLEETRAKEAAEPSGREK